MKYYKLRVDLEIVSAQDVIALIRKYSKMFMYCYEGGDDNPHMHVYLEVSKLGATLRMALRNLGLKGNASYSLKECDERYPLEYLSYIMKEGQWTNEGIPEDIISQAKDHDDKVKREMKEKKAKRIPTIDKIIELCEPKWLEYIEGYHREIKRVILQYHIDNGLLVRKFALMSYYDTIRLRYNSMDKCIDEFFS